MDELEDIHMDRTNICFLTLWKVEAVKVGSREACLTPDKNKVNINTSLLGYLIKERTFGTEKISNKEKVTKENLYPLLPKNHKLSWALAMFVCFDVLGSSQTIRVMSSAVSKPNHTFPGHESSERFASI